MNWLNDLTVNQKLTYSAILTVLIGVVMFSAGVGLDIHLAVNIFLIITGVICGIGGILWFVGLADTRKLQLFKEG